MPLPGVSKEAMVGTAVLGVAFVAGVLVGKKYHATMFRTRRSQKAFEKDNHPGRDYASHQSLREHPVLKKLRLRALEDPAGVSPVSCEEAQLMTNLAKLIKAKVVLAVGDSVTYCTLSLALSLPDDGKVLTCLVAEDDARIGQPFWKEAGVEQKIDLRMKPAVQTLHELVVAEKAETYDLAFINAADTPLPNDCYEKVLRLVRQGGVIILSGVLCQGRVLNPKKGDQKAECIHQMNEKILRDVRVNISILPMGDGVTLAFKL